MSYTFTVTAAFECLKAQSSEVNCVIVVGEHYFLFGFDFIHTIEAALTTKEAVRRFYRDYLGYKHSYNETL